MAQRLCTPKIPMIGVVPPIIHPQANLGRVIQIKRPTAPAAMNSPHTPCSILAPDVKRITRFIWMRKSRGRPRRKTLSASDLSFSGDRIRRWLGGDEAVQRGPRGDDGHLFSGSEAVDAPIPRLVLEAWEAGVFGRGGGETWCVVGDCRGRVRSCIAEAEVYDFWAHKHARGLCSKGGRRTEGDERPLCSVWITTCGA